MKVFKFGGASIKDAPSIKNILEIISRIVDRSEFLEFKSNYGNTANNI